MIKSIVLSMLLTTAMAVTGPGAAASKEAGQETPITQTAGEKEESEASGAELTMLSGAGGSQMLGVVIHSEGGKTVVIDGGWDDDGDQLLETIKRKGQKVDVWLITNPHSDHIGALRHILRERADQILIDKIYYSFAPLSWYEEVAPEDAPTVSTLMEELRKLPQGTLCDTIKKGFEIEAGDIHITVLNDRYALDSDPINNSSIVYSVKAGGQTILFLGDMGYDGGYRLLKDSEELLKADLVQMAHHGQNGVDKPVYQAISPRVCLWPTPQWLWDNDKGEGYDTGPWRTIETREWMQSLGVSENYCIKDGEIVLQLKE